MQTNALTFNSKHSDSRYPLIAAILSLIGTSAFAQQAEIDPEIGEDHEVEVYVSEEALQVLYQRDASLLEGRNATLEGGVFLTENRDIVGIASAISQVGNQTRYPRWTFEVGARGYGALLEGEDEDVFGLALGGQARYAFGNSQQMAAAIGAYYAPDILTFGDADGVYDAFLRLEFRLRPGLTAFVGYRLLEIDQAQNRELDDHGHVGVRWAF